MPIRFANHEELSCQNLFIIFTIFLWLPFPIDFNLET